MLVRIVANVNKRWASDELMKGITYGHDER